MTNSVRIGVAIAALGALAGAWFMLDGGSGDRGDVPASRSPVPPRVVEEPPAIPEALPSLPTVAPTGPDLSVTVTPVDPRHPVAAGIEQGYEISDELYLCPVFEELVTPLLRSSHAFVPENFYSSALAIQGKMFASDGWTHPPGSNLAAWAQRIGRSQTATILGGDGPAAYENPGLRRLLENTIRWVADETRRNVNAAT